MTAEKLFFLQCLRDYCHGRKTAEPENDIDLKKLLEIADQQDLQAVLFEQFRKWPSQSGKLRNAFLNAVAVSVNRADMLQEIAKRFQNENIPFICMKGAVFRDYYPVPEVRTMGDVDFIIRTEDRQKSNKILMEDMHFERMIDNHAVWTYWTGQFMFEVHDHMFYEDLAVEYDYRAYFDQVWQYSKQGSVFGVESENLLVPSESFHFLYLMTHTAKHVINKGMGFRAFLDMVFIVHKCSDKMDWLWIEKQLEELKLLEFTKKCFTLCEHWFDVRMPMSAAELSDGFVELITEKMFQDGLFGLENEENTGAHSAKEIARARTPYWITAASLTIRKLFPPYEDMQLIPWYSFVDGRPWLLPAAWIYRWYYCLIHKREAGMSLLSEPFTKRNIIEKREDYLKTWGLYSKEE